MKHLPMLLAITLCLPITFSAPAEGEDVFFGYVESLLSAPKVMCLGAITGGLAGVMAVQNPQNTLKYTTGAAAVSTLSAAAISLNRTRSSHALKGSTLFSLMATAWGFVTGFLIAEAAQSRFS